MNLIIGENEQGPINLPVSISTLTDILKGKLYSFTYCAIFNTDTEVSLYLYIYDTITYEFLYHFVVKTNKIDYESITKLQKSTNSHAGFNTRWLSWKTIHIL